MTNWTPDLSATKGSRYLGIANALARDVHSGRLRVGERLPTHRDLAYRLGVTVGTVTRAYAEAQRRGLIDGEVGRGTYVRGKEPRTPVLAMIEAPQLESKPIDLSLNFPPRGEDDAFLAAALGDLGRRPGIAAMLDYHPHRGVGAHRSVAAEWLAHPEWRPSAEQVIVTAGAQHAMMVAFAGLTQPGDLVLTEALTYPGMKTIANLLRLRLHGLAMDEHGIRPDSFANACRNAAPKALYCMANVQNPTGVTMPASRRAEIAAIAVEHNVPIVEDDIHRFLDPDAPAPLASHAPALGHYLTSLSKSLAPGLRIGFLVVPAGPPTSFVAAVRTTTWMTSPLMAELATMWIRDGTAARVAATRRLEAIARQAIVRDKLAGFAYAADPASFHGWLTLPAPWRSEPFAARARDKGILVTPAEAFAVGRPAAAIRLCAGAAASRAELGRALDLLVEILRGSPEAEFAIL